MPVKLLRRLAAMDVARRHRSFVVNLRAAPGPRRARVARAAGALGRVLRRNVALCVRRQHVTTMFAPRAQIFLPTREFRVLRHTSTQMLREHTRECVERILTCRQQVQTRLQEHRLERNTILPAPAAMTPVSTATPARNLAPAPMVIANPRPLAAAVAVPSDRVEPAPSLRAAHESHTPSIARPAAAPLAAKELSRLTEHVIQALDRRVLSYRERLGQV